MTPPNWKKHLRTLIQHARSSFLFEQKASEKFLYGTVTSRNAPKKQKEGSFAEKNIFHKPPSSENEVRQANFLQSNISSQEQAFIKKRPKSQFADAKVVIITHSPEKSLLDKGLLMDKEDETLLNSWLEKAQIDHSFLLALNLNDPHTTLELLHQSNALAFLLLGAPVLGSLFPDLGIAPWFFELARGHELDLCGRPAMITFHPRTLRSPQAKPQWFKQVESDIERLVGILLFSQLISTK